MPKKIETDRLVLEAVYRCKPDELYDAFNVNDEESVFSLCGWSKHQSITETEEFISEARKERYQGERFRYAVRLKSEDEIIGTTYIDCSTFTMIGVLGLWIDKPYWGHGISGERADALIESSFKNLNLTSIRVGCLSDNEKSRKSIEKYIHRHGGIFYGVPPVTSEVYSSHPTKTRPHYEYAIRISDYRSDEAGISCSIPGINYEQVEFSN